MEKKIWTSEDDALIIQLVNRYGSGKWTQISRLLRDSFSTKRSQKQIRQRWHNHLNPQITKIAWSVEEQKRLFAAHKTYGNKWSQISKLFPGRTDNCIKNHFYSTLRRTLRKLNKQLGDRESADIIKSIRPRCLTKMFAIAEQKEEQIQNRSLYESCRYLKELLTESLENIEYKKNLASVLQRKQYFKKILTHIKELNSKQDESDEGDGDTKNRMQKVEKEAEKSKPQVQFYLNYQELQVLKYEEMCLEQSIQMTMNPRQFLRVFNQQNIKQILEDTYKLNMLKCEGKQLKIFDCNKKGFFQLIQQKIQQKKMMIDLVMKNSSDIGARHEDIKIQ